MADITQEVERPSGGTAVIRRINGRQMAKARESKSVEGLQKYLEHADLRAKIEAVYASRPKSDVAPEPTPTPVDPMQEFDAYVVIKRGLVSVSTGEDLSTDALRDAFVEDLSEDDVRALASAIVRLSAPRLFATSEEAQKNG
jgi:hypothetical protein